MVWFLIFVYVFVGVLIFAFGMAAYRACGRYRIGRLVVMSSTWPLSLPITFAQTCGEVFGKWAKEHFKRKDYPHD